MLAQFQLTSLLSFLVVIFVVGGGGGDNSGKVKVNPSTCIAPCMVYKPL